MKTARLVALALICCVGLSNLKHVFASIPDCRKYLTFSSEDHKSLEMAFAELSQLNRVYDEAIKAAANLSDSNSNYWDNTSPIEKQLNLLFFTEKANQYRKSKRKLAALNLIINEMKTSLAKQKEVVSASIDAALNRSTEPELEKFERARKALYQAFRLLDEITRKDLVTLSTRTGMGYSAYSGLKKFRNLLLTHREDITTSSLLALSPNEIEDINNLSVS